LLARSCSWHARPGSRRGDPWSSGHARKVKAIGSWLNRRYGQGNRIAWAKQDPTRTDLSIPDEIKKEWSSYKPALDRYGKEVYALFRPTTDKTTTEAALTAFLDFLFDERGYEPLARWQSSAQEIRSGWLDDLMPGVERSALKELLASRRYVILQGPPGTGKTKMALDLLFDDYKSVGRSIQFHANTTYENFVGGLAPDHSDGVLGFAFQGDAGCLNGSSSPGIRRLISAVSVAHRRNQSI
jgi:5-methylcytosine-specific restriction protein B